MKQEAIDQISSSIKIQQLAVAGIDGWLDKNLIIQAAEAIKVAKNILTSGCGNSGIACKKLAHTLCCINISASFMPPSEVLHGGIGGFGEGDCALLLSRGGKTSELIPIMEICAMKGITTILLTENIESELAKLADIVVHFVVERESDKHNFMATTSIIIPLIIFDAIIACLIEETDYKRADFGLIHPNGAVGKMLKQEKSNV